MPSVFRPPTVAAGPRLLSRSRGPERDFFRRAAPLVVGQSVLKLDGSYVTVMTPTVAQTLAATEYYAGGHEHVVSDTIATALTAAGYGAYLEAL